MTLVAPSIPVLPQVPDSFDFKDLGPLSVYLANLTGALSREIARRVVKDIAVDEVLLRSDNGSVYRVRIGNTGSIYTEVVFQAP